MDGSIVKVHCLAKEPTKLGMAAMGMAQRTPKSSKPVAGAGQATSAGAAARGAAKATASEASTSSGGTPQAAGAKAATVGLLAPGSVAALLQACDSGGTTGRVCSRGAAGGADRRCVGEAARCRRPGGAGRHCVRYSLLCATPMHVRTPTLRTVMRPPSRGAQAHLLCSDICSSRCLLSRHACLTPVSPTLPGLYSIYSSAGHSQAENTLLAINALVISQS